MDVMYEGDLEMVACPTTANMDAEGWILGAPFDEKGPNSAW